MGITTLEQIQDLGFEEMCRKYIEYYPDRLNANAFLGIICSLDGTVWTKASLGQRRQAAVMVDLLRRELGLPPRSARKRERPARGKVRPTRGRVREDDK